MQVPGLPEPEPQPRVPARVLREPAQVLQVPAPQRGREPEPTPCRTVPISAARHPELPN